MLFALVLILSVLLVVSVTRCTQLSLRGDAVEVRSDTVTVVRVDTLRYEAVQYRDRWRVRTDTVSVVTGGKGGVGSENPSGGDTIRVPIPIGRYVYTDDNTYRAEISGYGVSLDRMDVYRRTAERTITVDRMIALAPKRFGLGVQLGYGISLDGRPQPYIGIGVSYNFIRF